MPRPILCTCIYVNIDVTLNIDFDANVTCEQALKEFSYAKYTGNIYTLDYF